MSRVPRVTWSEDMDANGWFTEDYDVIAVLILPKAKLKLKNLAQIDFEYPNKLDTRLKIATFQNTEFLTIQNSMFGGKYYFAILSSKYSYLRLLKNHINFQKDCFASFLEVYMKWLASPLICRFSKIAIALHIQTVTKLGKICILPVNFS